MYSKVLNPYKRRIRNQALQENNNENTDGSTNNTRVHSGININGSSTSSTSGGRRRQGPVSSSLALGTDGHGHPQVQLAAPPAGRVSVNAGNNDSDVQSSSVSQSRAQSQWNAVARATITPGNNARGSLNNKRSTATRLEPLPVSMGKTRMTKVWNPYKKPQSLNNQRMTIHPNNALGPSSRSNGNGNVTAVNPYTRRRQPTSLFSRMNHLANPTALTNGNRSTDMNSNRHGPIHEDANGYTNQNENGAMRRNTHSASVMSTPIAPISRGQILRNPYLKKNQQEQRRDALSSVSTPFPASLSRVTPVHEHGNSNANTAAIAPPSTSKIKRRQDNYNHQTAINSDPDPGTGTSLNPDPDTDQNRATITPAQSNIHTNRIQQQPATHDFSASQAESNFDYGRAEEVEQQREQGQNQGGAQEMNHRVIPPAITPLQTPLQKPMEEMASTLTPMPTPALPFAKPCSDDLNKATSQMPSQLNSQSQSQSPSSDFKFDYGTQEWNHLGAPGITVDVNAGANLNVNVNVDACARTVSEQSKITSVPDSNPNAKVTDAAATSTDGSSHLQRIWNYANANGKALFSPSAADVGGRHIDVDTKNANANGIINNMMYHGKKRMRNDMQSNCHSNYDPGVEVKYPFATKIHNSPNVGGDTDAGKSTNNAAFSAVTPYKTPRKKLHWTNEGSGRHRHRHRHRRPEIMFLIEAMNNARERCNLRNESPLSKSNEQQSWSADVPMVQIQGVVMTDPVHTSTSFARSTCTLQKSVDGACDTKTIAFAIDDGTAIIDVLYTTPFKGDEYEAKKEKLLSALSLSPRRKVAKGDTVDCKGCIEYIMTTTAKENDDEIQSVTKVVAPTAVPCFVVDVVSFVSDPDLESLRVAQIAHLRKHAKEYNEPNSLQNFNKPELNGSMYLYGVPKWKSNCPMIHEPNRVFVDPKRLLHLIHLSKPTGLAFQDLEAIFHFESFQEICALRNGLKMLQSNFEIYVSRDGAYLPL